MNLLLDTHVALWAITDSPKLPHKARELISSRKTTVWVSVASVWEIAIKHSLGRGDMPVSSQDAARYFGESGYRLLPIEAEHVVAVEDLPAHHQEVATCIDQHRYILDQTAKSLDEAAQFCRSPTKAGDVIDKDVPGHGDNAALELRVAAKRSIGSAPLSARLASSHATDYAEHGARKRGPIVTLRSFRAVFHEAPV